MSILVVVGGAGRVAAVTAQGCQVVAARGAAERGERGDGGGGAGGGGLRVAAVGLAALQRWVIAIKKNQLPTTLPITSILSSWHYQLK